jgi:copper chaperone CopZ
MPALARRKLTLPVDLIGCPTCLSQIERLITATDGFVDVVVDFEAGRTTIEYPAPVLDPFPHRTHLGGV